MSIDNPYLFAIEALQGVRHLIIGGFASVLHGNCRFTPDLNVLLDLEPQNIAAAVSSFESFGLTPSSQFTLQSLASENEREKAAANDPWCFLSLHFPDVVGFRLEILLKNPQPFEELAAQSKTVATVSGPVTICNLPLLLALKRAAARPQDLIDLENLAIAKHLMFHRAERKLDQIVQHFPTVEKERVESLAHFQRLSSDERIAWLADMLDALGKFSVTR